MVQALVELPRLDEFVNRFGKIEALQSEVRRHVTAIHDLFVMIARAAGGRKTANGRRRGRPPGRRRVGRPRTRMAAAMGAGGGRKRRRGKRGALKAAIHKALAGGKVSRPVEVMKTLPKLGYRTASDPKVFYNTVYLALKKDKAIEKTGEGFRLKK